MKLHPPDFIILHFFRATKLSLWFWRRLKRSGAKFIVIYHDVESLLFTDKTDTDLRSHLELSDLIVVHNQFSRDELQQKYPFVKDKITIIPHGDFNGLPSAISKSEARKKLNIDENIPLVLFFGMIKPSKGLDTLLKAMLNADAKLIIAGRLRNCNLSDFDKPMKVLLQQEKLITDIGYIASDKRDLYLKAADMIVLPYKKIYQSGVLLMALSYGLPVIASDLLPNKEFSEPLKSVLLFRTGDAEDLAEKINHLLGDPDARESLRINGVQKLKKDHSWKTIGSIYSKIISE